MYELNISPKLYLKNATQSFVFLINPFYDSPLIINEQNKIFFNWDTLVILNGSLITLWNTRHSLLGFTIGYFNSAGTNSIVAARKIVPESKNYII